MISVLLMLAAASAQPQGTRVFTDWEVGCDNGRHCKAVGLVPENQSDAEAVYWVTILERGPEPDAAPNISVELMGEEYLAAGLLADGKPTGLAFNAEGALQGDPGEAAAVFAKARKLSLVNDKGEVIGLLSPNGATAALRWLDQQQQRSGTVTALVAKGGKPAAQVSPAPPLPAIEAAPSSSEPARTLTTTEIAAIQAKHECDQPPETQTGYVRLDAAHSLAVVPCGMGAYQGNSVVVLVMDTGGYRVPDLERPFLRDGVPVEEMHLNILTTASFDPETRTLWSEYRGRGLNDCGGAEAYVWDGSRFRLAYHEFLDECRGARTRITLWRTANIPE